MALLKNVTCMNPGNGKTSYANNSGLQKAIISETLPILDETLKEMISTAAGDGFWKCLKVVDLGCSSGPNTIFIISHILDTIQRCPLHQNNFARQYSPEFEVFLNDLSDNDFNNLYKLLQNFRDQANRKKIRRCFFHFLPGSFYGRLLPTNSIHFAYSSYSIHWLSQIPQGLRMNNKENIFVGKSSPPEVLEAYAKQYEIDFSTFLSARGSEIVPGGRMVLAFLGRSVEDPSFENNAAYLTLLSQSLLDMVDEGLVKMDDLYSFNLPIYLPCKQEVETVIQNEGSFNLDMMRVFRVPWDAHDNDEEVEEEVFLDIHRKGKVVADCVRAVMEPMLATHFGGSIVDRVFERYAERVAMHLSKQEGSYFTILISLSRK